MPDPNGPFYRHTKEYHDRLIERELYKLYKSDYPDMKWVQGVMERLERKESAGDYSDQDRFDLKKARAIVARVTAKHSPGEERKEEERSTTRYIWRTQGDGKVRPEHAANEGKIFAWDTPPPTGHPGEAFGCRCWAEPHEAEDGERELRGEQSGCDYLCDRFHACVGR